MKKFLLQIIFLIFLPVAVIVWVCEWSIRRIPNDYSYKNERMEKSSTAIQILNFGSSHGYFGISPKYFSYPAFNLAFVSQSIKYDYFLYNRYAPQCDSLRIVILPVSYGSLRSELEGGGEDWRVRNYCVYMGCDYHRGEWRYNMEISNRNKISDVLPSWFQELSYISCDEYGWGTSYAKANRDSLWQESGEIAAKRHTKADTSAVVANVQRLESIIQDCEHRGVRVILLTTPTYHTYYEQLEEKQYKETIATCSDLERRHGNVLYLNWIKNPDFTEDDFFDADHLNEYGAKKLTGMLNLYIQ